MQRTTLGDFELTVVTDGLYYLDGGAMFGVVPKTLWAKHWVPDEQNRLRAGLTSLIIRTGERTVLVDTGIGNKLTEKMQRIYGNTPSLFTALEEAKVAPDEVDTVINTHLHFDHCGWNTVIKNDRAVAAFPNARYYVQQGELEHAHEQHERDRVSYLTDNYDPLVANGQMQLLRGDTDILPGISVKVFPGHTRNHQVVIVRSQGKTACYVGDLIPTSAHLPPTWVMAYDLFPLDSIASRHRYYEEAVPQNWLTVFTHDPTTLWAHVQRDEKGKLIALPVANEVASLK